MFPTAIVDGALYDFSFDLFPVVVILRLEENYVMWKLIIMKNEMGEIYGPSE
jgi:hypothetical protein